MNNQTIFLIGKKYTFIVATGVKCSGYVLTLNYLNVITISN